tara:strand:+ start:912 stop:2699 length:1788 start_codon:yes stop_codon:yes gene_type:complete
MTRLIILFLLLFLNQSGYAQKKEYPLIHSHNDYYQKVPFWQAYSCGLNSIEIDIFLKNDSLYVTHSEDEIIKNRDIESLYLEPVLKALELGFRGDIPLQFLIDVKSDAKSTLQKLIKILKNYPQIIENQNINLVISGNRPPPEEYTDYPDYIHFDYQSLDPIHNPKTWDKISLISLSFRKISEWNGKGRLVDLDYRKIKSIIEKAHAYKKPFRFWAAPDSKTAWKVFRDLRVDFINTDQACKASDYLNTLDQRLYSSEKKTSIYIPTFEHDQKKIAVDNIILMIGDGNGLSQISAASLVNGGELTLTQLKSIGLIKTQSADDYITDSAAAATAIAIGEKTKNRAIGLDAQYSIKKNITEILHENGFISGCITSDEIIGATPASFYAHRRDRSEKNGMIEDLLKSKLSLFVGGGAMSFNLKDLQEEFYLIDNINELEKCKKERVGYFISEKDVPSVDLRGNIISKATSKGICFLNNKQKPFFLMVEGAQIDSYGHENHFPKLIKEVIDFDLAIAEAIKFADQNKNTLVLITADHETSGLSILSGNLDNNSLEGSFASHDHTGMMVPVFAYGPYSQSFQGVYNNYDLFHKIIGLMVK